MHRNTTRSTAVIGTAMALLLAGTAAVSAHGGGRGGPDDTLGVGGIGGPMGAAMPGGRGFGLRGLDDTFERREVTLQTTNGTTASRVEQGAVESISDSALTFSFADGQSVTVALDDSTDLIGIEEAQQTVRGWSRTRMVANEITANDVAAGDQVVVWSSSEDGTDFTASQVVVQVPDTTATSDGTAPSDDSATADESPAALESPAAEAAATDA